MTLVLISVVYLVYCIILEAVENRADVSHCGLATCGGIQIVLCIQGGRSFERVEGLRWDNPAVLKGHTVCTTESFH